jgi:hypothetical protein
MPTTVGIFDFACSGAGKHSVVRSLRRTFSDIVSKHDVVVHKLIMALEGGSEDDYQQKVSMYGTDGTIADERIREAIFTLILQ